MFDDVQQHLPCFPRHCHMPPPFMYGAWRDPLLHFSRLTTGIVDSHLASEPQVHHRRELDLQLRYIFSDNNTDTTCRKIREATEELPNCFYHKHKRNHGISKQREISALPNKQQNNVANQKGTCHQLVKVSPPNFKKCMQQICSYPKMPKTYATDTQLSQDERQQKMAEIPAC